MNADKLIPDCCHIKRADAEDLAAEVVDAIRSVGRAMSLYLDAHGVVGCSWVDGDTFAGMPLVGRYDGNATAAQITEDILAMQREAIA